MINANNIAELLNYIKKHKEIGNLRLNIKGKDIKITKSKKIKRLILKRLNLFLF